MVNLLNESRFIILSRNLSGVFKSLITTFTLFSIFLFWLFLFYLPIDLKINAERGLYQSFVQEKSSYQKIIEQSNILEKENIGLTQKIEGNNFNFDLLRQNIDFILSSLDENNLRCSELKPLEIKLSKSLDKEYYLFKANGDYKKVMSFFNNLDKAGRGIKFKDMEIVKNEQDKVFIVTKMRLIDNLKL